VQAVATLAERDREIAGLKARVNDLDKTAEAATHLMREARADVERLTEEGEELVAKASSDIIEAVRQLKEARTERDAATNAAVRACAKEADKLADIYQHESIRTLCGGGPDNFFRRQAARKVAEAIRLRYPEAFKEGE